jgi:mono/diheme cytochrome c family protein
MLKNLSIIILTLLAVTGVSLNATARTEQAISRIIIPTVQTSPANGAHMYAVYCASCHGISGKGDGPSAIALKTPPTNLTVLSRNNRGKFPTSHVMSVLRFGPDIPSHGTPEMPVWGPVLGKMDQADQQATQLRITNLSRYLETIQEK